MDSEPVNTAQKKTKRKRPSASAMVLKRKKVLKTIMEKQGNTSVSAAMRDAGFSDSYAKNPQHFLGTKTTQDLLEQYFPDDYLHQKTKELIEASELESYTFPVAKDKKKTKLTNDEIRYIVEQMAGCRLIYIRDSYYPEGRIAFFRAPAHRARKDGLEMAFKLKGAFKADASNPLDKNPFAKMTDEELALAIKEAKAVLTKKK